MLYSSTRRLLLASTMLTPLVLASCSSGGSGGGGSGGNVTPATIGAFAAAGEGSTPPSNSAGGLQTASAGGASFSGATKPSVGDVFALTQSAYSVSRSAAGNITAVAADAATNAAGATVVVVNPTTATYELRIPGLGIDTTLQANGQGVRLSDGSYLYLSTDLASGNVNAFNNVVVGRWTQYDSSNLNLTHAGYFDFGYQTPLAGMPTGSASYSSSGDTIGTVYTPSTTNGAAAASLSGDASLTVNFGAGTLTGSLTNMIATSASGQRSSWDSVAFSASIAGTTFAGSTSVTTNPGTAFSLGAAATGAVNGGFYGATATEAAAVWTLSDGTNSALGVFGVEQNPASAAISPFDAPTVGAVVPSTTAAGFQQASGGGPTFTGTSPATGTVFALTQSAVAIGLATSAAPGGGQVVTSVASDTATEQAGATLTVSNPSNGSYELKVPHLGIDVVLQANGPGQQLPSGAVAGLSALNPSRLLNYAELGDWATTSATSSATSNFGYFVFGYQTPLAGLPSSGTATYSGTGNVSGLVVSPGQTGGAVLAGLRGDASLSANFTSGAVTGALTNMIATGQGAQSVWNTVSISGALSGSNFSGTTAATSAPGTTYALTGAATGNVTGALYGPTANEAAAVWTLSDGTRSAVGVFGAPQTTAPSDRRIKRDITHVATTAEGLKLYRFRYLGDDTVFEGVMAQDLLENPLFARALVAREGGLFEVDYGLLGVTPPQFARMQAVGRTAAAVFELEMAAA